ncbi:MAG TPA: S-layer homology domain-containing protein [Clostridia bacterium]|nr:S-layer homology domain-containing protein [Clostridia bacterium]
MHRIRCLTRTTFVVVFVALMLAAISPLYAGTYEASSSVQVTFAVVDSPGKDMPDDQTEITSPTPEAIEIYRDAVKIEANVSRGRIGEKEALSDIGKLIEEANRVVDPDSGLHPAMGNVVRIQIGYALASVVNSLSTMRLESAAEANITCAMIEDKANSVMGLIEYLEERLTGTSLEALLADLPRAVTVVLPEDTDGDIGDKVKYIIETDALEMLQDKGLGLYLGAGRVLFKCSPTVLLSPCSSELPDNVGEDENDSPGAGDGTDANGVMDGGSDMEENTDERPSLELIVEKIQTDGFDRSLMRQDGLARVGPVYNVSLSIPCGSYVRVGLSLKSSELQGFDLRKLGVCGVTEDDSLHLYRGRYSGKDRMVEFTTGESGQYSVLSQTKTFNDIGGHWAKDEIEVLASQNVLLGTGNGLFSPEGWLTRAEFMAMIVRAYGLLDYEGEPCTFRDVAENDWYVKYLSPAVSVGLIGGYTDNTFRPHNEITRQEMAVLVSRALGMAGKGRSIKEGVAERILGKFHDLPLVSPWAREDLARVIDANLMNGLPTGNFEPRRYATRAESSVLLQRLLVYTDLLPPYPFDLY